MMSFSVYTHLGNFLLPDEVQGSIDSYDSYYRNAYMEQATSGEGYTQQSYFYSHPFPQETALNTGLNFDLMYRISGNFSIGMEYGHSFSLRDYYSTHTIVDTLSAESWYSPIPHDYMVQRTVSNDQLYTKLSLYGIAYAARIPVFQGRKLEVKASIGTADYYQLFHIEHAEVTQTCYDNNGHEVYFETVSPSFSVFGIKYSSFYFRPSFTLLQPLTGNFLLRAGISLPCSYIEKGFEWNENQDYNSTTVFYPKKRFIASNPEVTLGIETGFWKR